MNDDYDAGFDVAADDAVVEAEDLTRRRVVRGRKNGRREVDAADERRDKRGERRGMKPLSTQISRRATGKGAKFSIALTSSK